MPTLSAAPQQATQSASSSQSAFFTSHTPSPLPHDSPIKGAGDTYVDVGPLPGCLSNTAFSSTQSDTSGPFSASAQKKAANSSSQTDIALLASLSPVLQQNFLVANPKLAARTLIALVSQNGHPDGQNPFRSRDMSCDARKTVINEIRDTESRALWGAIIDESDGRILLATWLRETIDDPDSWAPTRMPLLRLMQKLPMLKVHILDDATKHCMGRAIGAIVKRGQEKSRNLAGEIRAKWMQIADDSHTKLKIKGNNSIGGKRLAIGADEGAKKKSKVTATAAGSPASTPAQASPKMTNQDTMQTLNSLAQSSAYLSATTSLAGTKNLATTKFTARGSDRSAELSSLAKKTVTRTSSEVKEVCPRCKTSLIPGVTATTRVRREYQMPAVDLASRRLTAHAHYLRIASAAHGKRVDQVCLKCNEKVKKTPAPIGKAGSVKSSLALMDDSAEPDSASERKVAAKAPTRRTAGSKDMFSDLIAKPSTTSQIDRSSSAAKAVPLASQNATQQDFVFNPQVTSSTPTSKKSKKVRWRDENLVEVKLIESVLNADEEVHPSVEEHGLHVLELGEGQALRAAHVDLIDEEVGWSTPIDVDVSDAPPDRGTGSEEAKVQEQREKSVLSAIYTDGAQIPASAIELPESLSDNSTSTTQIRQFGLPQGWQSTRILGAPSAPEISELMRQLAGDSSSSQPRDAVTSLESLGISQHGLQGLLASIGGLTGDAAGDSGTMAGRQEQQPSWQSVSGQHIHQNFSAPNNSEYPYGEYAQDQTDGSGSQVWNTPSQWHKHSANPYR